MTVEEGIKWLRTMPQEYTLCGTDGDPLHEVVNPLISVVRDERAKLVVLVTDPKKEL